MSTVPDDDRKHPQEPAEGSREAVDEHTQPIVPEPRVHPQDPAEGPRD